MFNSTQIGRENIKKQKKSIYHLPFWSGSSGFNLPSENASTNTFCFLALTVELHILIILTWIYMNRNRAAADDCLRINVSIIETIN